MKPWFRFAALIPTLLLNCLFFFQFALAQQAIIHDFEPAFSASVLNYDESGIELSVSIEPPFSKNAGEMSFSIAVPPDANPIIDILEIQPGLDLPHSEIPEVFMVSKRIRLRGLEIALITVNRNVIMPAQSSMVKQTLKLRINYNSKNDFSHYARYAHPIWDRVLQKLILNHQVLPKNELISFGQIKGSENGAEYLIISPNGEEFVNWANTLKQFRMQQGYLSKVVTLDEIGGNSSTDIENYIDNAYNTWTIPPVAILLLGDDGENSENTIKAPIWDNYCYSDNVYADVNGDDFPDLLISRICAHNEDDLENTVGKIINYESAPPVENSFYQNPIVSFYFQNGSIRQILGESVAGFYEVILNKSSNRIYTATMPLPEVWATTPEALALVAYFGPEGLGYIPAQPGEVNSTWDGNTQDIIEGLNSGAFLTLYLGYGSSPGWANPSFTIADLGELNNEMPSFVWSGATLTGQFGGSGDCFAEAIQKHPSGAIGVVAASEIYFAPSADLMTMGAFDQLWPEYLPDFGTPVAPEGLIPSVALFAGKLYLEQSTWSINPNNKALTYHTFHYFGDPLSSIYSAVPQMLSVLHPDEVTVGSTTLSLTTNENAMIGLTINDEFVISALSTGEEINLELPLLNLGDTLFLTVTKQNYYRYGAKIPVVDIGSNVSDLIQNSRPFLIYPNPSAEKMLQIKWTDPSFYGNWEVTIYDLQMQVINRTMYTISENSQDIINTKSFKSGIYFIQIGNYNFHWIEKVIVL